MKIIFSFLIFISFLFSSSLKPTQTYIASGGVTDLVFKNSLLYVATDASSVNIFNTKTAQIETSIKVPKIKDFMGDEIDSKIYAVDIIKDKIMLVSQGSKGFREIYEYENGKLNLLISIDKKMFIARAKYLDETKIILSLLSNQLFVYDTVAKKFLWEVQVSHSKFSNFVLNKDKSKILIADESGAIKQVSSKTGKLEKEFSGLNVDNVFQIDLKNGVLITAGQDRRCGVYSDFNKYYKQADFLIYSAGLSPNGKIAGFASDEDNNITIFNTESNKDLYTLKGHKMTLTNIVFINENELFSSSDSNEVYYWKLN